MNSFWNQSLVVVALWMIPFSVAQAAEPARDSAAPWLTTLSLGNGGYWRQRVRIVLHNGADQPADGQTVEVKVGKADGLADLEGVPCRRLATG